MRQVAEFSVYSLGNYLFVLKKLKTRASSGNAGTNPVKGELNVFRQANSNRSMPSYPNEQAVIDLVAFSLQSNS
jgi:hypothetical protein